MCSRQEAEEERSAQAVIIHKREAARLPGKEVKSSLRLFALPGMACSQCRQRR